MRREVVAMGGEMGQHGANHIYITSRFWQGGIGRELQYRDDDTCVGYGSHRRTPRHGNGGRHYKTYEAVASRRLMLP